MSETPEPDAAELELPRAIALAWGIAANPQRGPKSEMSVERIVEAAIEVADADGLAAVSMSAVAARLGFTPMSLYRYVTAKDDLLLLMQEEAVGLPSEASRTAGDWRAQLTALYDGQVARYVRHPWVLDIPITGSPVTPNSAAWMDAGLHALADTPLSHEERLSVMLLVTGLARWTGIVFAGYARTQREADVTAAELTAREDALFRALVTEDAYPHLAAAIAAGVFLDDGDPFRFGVERALDGVAAYIASAPHPAAPPSAAERDDDSALLADKRYREAQKAVRQAERALRDARKAARAVAREARERLRRQN